MPMLRFFFTTLSLSWAGFAEVALIDEGSRTIMCGRGTPSSSTSSSSLATIVVVRGTGFGSLAAAAFADESVGLGMLSGGSGSGAGGGGAVAMTLFAVVEVEREAVLNTGAEVAIVVTVVAAAGVLREGNGVIDGAGRGELRWENGPDEAADDMGMGCSLSMLMRAALPELLGDCELDAGGGAGEECDCGAGGVDPGWCKGGPNPLNCFNALSALYGDIPAGAVVVLGDTEVAVAVVTVLLLLLLILDDRDLLYSSSRLCSATFVL